MTIKKLWSAFTLAVVNGLLVHASSGNAADVPMLWYAQPADKWTEALPLGNGHMGAMVFGGIGSERIQFNEDTLWKGRPHDYVRAGAGEQLAEIRRLVFEGNAGEAGKLAKEKAISDPVRQMPYQPFGDLRLTFPGHDSATGYRRELNLDDAIATTTYRIGKVEFKREAFASYPDRVIVVRLTASKPGQINFTLRMDSPHGSSQTRAEGPEEKAPPGTPISFSPAISRRPRTSCSLNPTCGLFPTVAQSAPEAVL
ncbi:MAG: glycoside hydrolase family 95 protein [Verrucomicrobiota bacterium]